MASRKKPEDLLDLISPEVLTKIVPTSKRRPDVFDSYRPKNVHTMIDYNISETNLRCRYKGMQLNVRSTEAKYLPKSEKDIQAMKRRQRTIYSHVGPPKWKFVDEVWRQKQEERQVVDKKKFEKLRQRNRRAFSKSGWSIHKKAQRLAGPTWYQELSPKQLIAVNNLKHSLNTPTHLIDNIKEDLAKLGIVPRPNSKKIHCALKYSCGKPVEFLLSLYHISKLNETKYCLNDRLLLSAVVHLTISDTLKELHKRIPSPPRCCCREPRKVEGTRRKVKCKSPYLEPYTFKPEPDRFSGVYYDKHIEYPTSPYFSYLFELYMELGFSGNVADMDLTTITDEEYKELVVETIMAQNVYSELHCWDNVQFLVPTVVNFCLDYEDLIKMEQKQETRTPILPSLATLDPIIEPKCTCQDIVEDIEVCCEATTNCDCDECRCRIKTRRFVSRLCERCDRKNEKKTARCFVQGMITIRCDLTVPVIGGTYVEPTCDCMETYRNRLKIFEKQDMLRCQRVKYVITGGVVMTKVGAVYCISTAVLNSRLRKLYASQRASTVIGSGDGDSTISNGTTDTAPCTCKTKETQSDGTHEREHCICCVCEEGSSSRTISTYSSTRSACKCARELKKVFDHKCTCEECIRRTRDPTFIINDTVETEEGTYRVIEGVHEQHCDCLSRHLEKIKKVEEYQKRVQARYQLRKQIQKYSIGGVCDTPLGPVYAICGVRQPVRCICAELAEEKQKLDEESRKKPDPPPEGRITYGIAGVARTSDRNVFVYDQAMLAERCPCESLFERFLENHGSCLRSYEEYLRMMAREIKYYEQEMGIDGSTGDVEGSSGDAPGWSGDAPGPAVVKQEGEGIGEDGPTSCSCAESTQIDETSSASRQHQLKSCCRCTSDSDDSVAFDSSYQIRFDPERRLSSADKLEDEHGGCKEESRDPKVNIRRFVILKSFPKNVKKLTEVLKNVLNTLAEDGFPLARLPECYKLPHFRLWLEMRTGRKWTREDRNSYLPISTRLYEHVRLCYKKAERPDLSAIKNSKHLTWRTANYWRNYAQEKKLCFYRDLKHRLIENTRELYPTRFAYEFYTHGYRDCFFAYTGGREGDLCPYLD